MKLTVPLQQTSPEEVNFDECDPDSIDILLRHLYREGMVADTSTSFALISIQLTIAIGLDVKALKTPLLCVSCWKLATNLHLDTLKDVVLMALGQHLDAMALLACSTSNLDRGPGLPKWLGYFLDACREVGTNKSMKPLRTLFAAFLWVTRFEVLVTSNAINFLTGCPGVMEEVIKLLVWNHFPEMPAWIPDAENIEGAIQNAVEYVHGLADSVICSECAHNIDTSTERVFYNPSPVGGSSIGQLTWCRQCVSKFNEECQWPWRGGGGRGEGDKISLEAWTL